MNKVVLIMPDGREVRVMEHQVADAISKFGASRVKKEVKDVPKELLRIPEVKKEPVSPLPTMEVTKKVKKDGRTKV